MGAWHGADRLFHSIPPPPLCLCAQSACVRSARVLVWLWWAEFYSRCGHCIFSTRCARALLCCAFSGVSRISHTSRCCWTRMSTRISAQVRQCLLPRQDGLGG